MGAQHLFAVRYSDLALFPREIEDKLSVHGLHLKSSREIQVGESVALQFRFPQREDPLNATGVVAWVSATPDAQGKRSVVVRNLVFDAESEKILDLVRSTPPAEESALATSVPARTPTPGPVQAPTPTPRSDVDQPPLEVARPNAAAQGAGAEAERRPKALFIALGIVGGLLIALLVWLFTLNGVRWVKMTFFAPPEALTVQMRAVPLLAPEPPMERPAAAPPPPKPIPPAVATSFDYFQRPAQNEFIITFNRPVAKVITSRIESPLTQSFYVEHALARLEKEQYFLPFEMVRTVAFEQDADVLQVRFLSQNPHYLPEPTWEIRGRELIIKFTATD
jgi:hypothetical protein